MKSEIHAIVLSELQKLWGTETAILNIEFISGGSINQTARLISTQGNFFLKWNEAKKFPDMFGAEAAGLKLLSETQTIKVPRVISVFKSETYQFLLLEWIEQKPSAKLDWHLLGEQLALLHRNTFDTFGLSQDNYIGSLHQFNKPSSSWIEFFIEKRLIVQLQVARERKLINQKISNQFEALFKKLPNLLPQERPSLIHGDLWRGNLIHDESGKPVLVDPAIYYGNREADIAMTKLFGGFGNTFYAQYNSSFPLIPDFENRLDIYNLYPLLVHVNLFGKSYLQQITSTLNRFI